MSFPRRLFTPADSHKPPTREYVRSLISPSEGSSLELPTSGFKTLGVLTAYICKSLDKLNFALHVHEYYCPPRLQIHYLGLDLGVELAWAGVTIVCPRDKSRTTFKFNHYARDQDEFFYEICRALWRQDAAFRLFQARKELADNLRRRRDSLAPERPRWKSRYGRYKTQHYENWKPPHWPKDRLNMVKYVFAKKLRDEYDSSFLTDKFSAISMDDATTSAHIESLPTEQFLSPLPQSEDTVVALV